MFGAKVAYYRKEDWDRFIEMIDDRESMHDTWEEWHNAYEKAKRDLIKEGYEVVKVVVDLDELADYCKRRNMKNDGHARSIFVQSK